MVTADILRHTGINISPAGMSPSRNSKILKKTSRCLNRPSDGVVLDTVGDHLRGAVDVAQVDHHR